MSGRGTEIDTEAVRRAPMEADREDILAMCDELDRLRKLRASVPMAGTTVKHCTGSVVEVRAIDGDIALVRHNEEPTWSQAVKLSDLSPYGWSQS